jgi:hypothetical protein
MDSIVWSKHKVLIHFLDQGWCLLNLLKELTHKKCKFRFRKNTLEAFNKHRFQAMKSDYQNVDDLSDNVSWQQARSYQVIKLVGLKKAESAVA